MSVHVFNVFQKSAPMCENKTNTLAAVYLHSQSPTMTRKTRTPPAGYRRPMVFSCTCVELIPTQRKVAGWRGSKCGGSGQVCLLEPAAAKAKSNTTMRRGGGAGQCYRKCIRTSGCELWGLMSAAKGSFPLLRYLTARNQPFSQACPN